MNTFLTTDWLSMTSLVLLTNQLEVTQFFNTSWNSDFQKPFAPGDTVRIKYPPKFVIRTGTGYTPQGIAEIQTSVTCNQTFGVDFEWTDVEAALKLERGDARLTDFYIKGPIAQIAQEWDSRSSLFAYQNANQIVGTLGTDPTTFAAFSNIAQQKLVEQACPREGDKAMIISPGVNTALMGSVVNTFNPVDAISKQYKQGVIGMQAGFKYFQSMSLYAHTAGSIAGAFTLAAAVASGATSLTVNLTAGDTLAVGDVIGLGATYNANPMTRRKTTNAYTKTVVVTQALTAAGGGADVVQISPTIYGPGSPYQNVDVLPANGATLTLFPGTSSPSGKSGVNGLAIHRDAYAVVFVPLELPSNQQISRQQRDPDTGASIRFVRAWDPVQSKMINRFDTLGGYGQLYPDNCVVRMLGA